ncbi:MAG: hypothetical protein ACKVIO_07195, partial [Phycisphaerales bacterium]
MKYFISLCSILLGLSALAQDECGPGTIWDAETSKCVPDPANCGAGTYWNYLESQCLPFDNCPADLDNDGQVAVTDLLLLLGAYSDFCPCELDSDADGVCDAEEVLGCTDDGACNYEVDATEDDASCAYPGFLCDLDEDIEYYAIFNENCDCVEEPGLCADENACNYGSSSPGFFEEFSSNENFDGFYAPNAFTEQTEAPDFYIESPFLSVTSGSWAVLNSFSWACQNISPPNILSYNLCCTSANSTFTFSSPAHGISFDLAAGDSDLNHTVTIVVNHALGQSEYLI